MTYSGALDPARVPGVMITSRTEMTLLMHSLQRLLLEKRMSITMVTAVLVFLHNRMITTKVGTTVSIPDGEGEVRFLPQGIRLWPVRG